MEALAARLARNGPLALRAIERTALETSGPRAFAEKRAPVFRGR